MHEVIEKKTVSGTLERGIALLSPQWAYRRAQFRAAYEVLDKHRTRTKRNTSGGTGDVHLDETALAALREIARDLGRNNPLAIGLLQTLTDSIVGEEGPKIEARSADDVFNREAEAAFRETAIEAEIDVTGRFTYTQIMHIAYQSYLRDGDSAILFTDDGPQLVEGEQIGTPWGKQQPDTFEIINGVAFSKLTGKLLGYYIGRPNKWGYVQQDSWKNYPATAVRHLFNPKRSSFSRGEPALTGAIKYLDYLSGYIDAELVAAKVNACFSAFVAQQNIDIPAGYTGGVSASGQTDEGVRHEKLEPGTIFYGRPGESITGIGQTRPGTLFDPFITKVMMLIGRPLCLPLMLVTLDFSGATFMNARIAYQKAQENWRKEQAIVVKRTAARLYREHIQSLVDKKLLKNLPPDYLKHEVICTRWPYVDPYKEALADEQQLKNATTTRTAVCARQGEDFGDVAQKLSDEKKNLKKLGLSDVTDQQAGRVQITN